MSVVDWLGGVPVVRVVNAAAGLVAPYGGACDGGAPHRRERDRLRGRREHERVWLARRLAALGVSVRLIACVRDEIEEVAAFLRAEGRRATW